MFEVELRGLLTELEIRLKTFCSLTYLGRVPPTDTDVFPTLFLNQFEEEHNCISFFVLIYYFHGRICLIYGRWTLACIIFTSFDVMLKVMMKAK